MNKTANYNLNQWEPGDKVQRVDFNADNAKIDAAFFNHPSAELLDSITVEEAIAGISFDISKVDWSRYLMLILTVDAASETGINIYMGSGLESAIAVCRGISNDIFGGSALAVSHYSSHLSALIPVLYDGSHAATAVAFGNSGISGGGGVGAMNKCSTLYINRQNGTFAPGDRGVLWGVK